MPGWELIGEEEKKAVDEVFDNGGVLYRYALNDRRKNIFRVNDFEKELAKKVGTKYCLCVCNGTAALKLALLGVGVKPGDEVITQSFTFVATVEAILELGAIPIITEVDKTLNMDPLDLERKINKKTKAIIPVPMAGVAPKMDEIMTIANSYGIDIVEDSCQALGATYKGKKLGTIGVVGVYSLDLGKVITTGEGGVLVTNDQKIYKKALEYSDHGHECNPNLPRGEDTRTIWGFNYKMMELQGAVGLAQLKKIDYVLQKQRENKKKIKDAIEGTRGLEFREIPDPEGDAGDTLIFFVKDRETASNFAKKLKEKGLGTKNLPDAIDWHYAGTWTHMFSDHPEYKGMDLEKLWSQSTNYVRRAIAIPIMVNMDDTRIKLIVDSIKQIANEVC